MAVRRRGESGARATGGDALGRAASGLVRYAIRRGLVDEADAVWAYNAVLDAVGACAPAPVKVNVPPLADRFDLDEVLAVLADEAIANGRDEDTLSGRDRAATRAMGSLMPRPSAVAARFEELRGTRGARAATDWFYRLCCDAGYVRASAVARNIEWETKTPWGTLEITINRSKPEKDPRDIASAAKVPAGDAYPACQLCMENEGYPGRPASAPGGAHPARQNLRVVPLALGGERWGLQYSPYAYFSEHCVAMSEEHRPMRIDRACLARLLDFVDLIPHYFVGSNADLPVVGGSILSHDHFQGGAHDFPMMRAEAERDVVLAAFPGVDVEVLRWPLTVLRLRSRDRDGLLGAAMRVRDVWAGWSDDKAGIVARTCDGVRHNTVTPIVRRVDDEGRRGGDVYEMYLALRCNIASDEHPMGVFHPHEGRWHVKKENIGLIEVMGLAILPPRLAPELDAVRAHLQDALVADADPASGAPPAATCAALRSVLEADPLSAAHADWAMGVLERRAAEIAGDDAERVLREEVGLVFSEVLEDAGVFKWDDAGRAALERFLAAL